MIIEVLIVGNPYLGITSGSPVSRPQSARQGDFGLSISKNSFHSFFVETSSPSSFLRL